MGDITELRFTVDAAGEAAPGVVFYPAGEDGLPLVVIQHPGTSSKDDYFVRDVGMMWARSGWACMGLDAPGHGERADHDPMGVLRDPERFEQATRQFSDELSAAVTAAADELPIDVSRLGYVGYSMGSMRGIPAVAADGRYRAAAFCLVGLGGRMGVSADGESPVKKLESVAVRVIGKTGDELFPRDSVQALYEALPSPDKDLVWFSGGHFDIGADVIGAAREWLALKL
jgi:dienelactone hydrolase